MGRNCCYKSCKSDSRHSKNVKFFSVPKPGKNNKNIEKTKAWVSAINRLSITVNNVKPHHYVCSRHFVAEDGPTKENPDPLRGPEIKLENDPSDSDDDNVGLNKSSAVTYLKNCSIYKSVSNSIHELNVTPKIENKFSLTAVSLNELANPNDDLIDKSGAVVSPSDHQNLNENSCISSDQDSVLSNAHEYDTGLNLKKVKLELIQKINSLWDVICEKDCVTVARKQKGVYEMSLRINENMTVELFIFKKKIDEKNDLKNKIASPLIRLGDRITCMQEVLDCLKELQDWTPCWGIEGTIFDTLKNSEHPSGFFCLNSSSMRSRKCEIFFKGKNKTWCQNCALFRKILRQKLKRQKNTVHVIKKNTNLRYLTLQQIQEKIKLTRRKNSELLRRNKTLEQKVNKAHYAGLD